MNTRNSKKSTQVIHQEYKDAEGNIHSEYKDAEGNIHSEYKDIQGNTHSEYKDAEGNAQSYKTYKNGYIDGNLTEKQNQDLRESHADKNISKGMLIGIIVACVAGLTAGTIYFLTKMNNPQPVSVINVPTERSEPIPIPPPPQIKVVEKPIVTIVPIPQAKTPESTVNITTPPSVSTPNPKPKIIKEVKPPQKSDALVPKPVLVSPSNGNVTNSTPNRKPAPANEKSTSNDGTTIPNLMEKDNALKTEILKQFEKNLPNNQLIVEVKNADVTISGNASTPEQLQQIQPLLNSIQGIGKVDITAKVTSKGVAE
jgi:hypothetical protein